jgi:hypothetical protein
MENKILEVVYVFNDINNTKGIDELRLLADDIMQRNGWILALWNDRVIGGVKEEYLKAFYLTSSN